MQSKGRTSETHPIDIQFLKEHWGEDSKGVLGISFAPGKKQANALTGPWYRDLPTDLNRMKEHFNIEGVVCLIEDFQFKKLQIQDLLPSYQKYGMITYHFPVVDGSVPTDVQSYKQLVKKVVDEHIIKEGKRMMVHCMGGLGRAGTFAAACLIYRGLTPEQAIAAVRSVRSPRCIETGAQENFLKNLTFKS